MWPAIARAIETATGKPFRIERHAAVTGGCINRAYRIDSCAAAYFLKLNSADRRDMFAAEAAGLEEIARTGTVRVPRVVCHGTDGTMSWLVTEYVALAQRGNHAALGRQLAALHRVTFGTFGWWRDNSIGTTSQPNTPGTDWVEFWRGRRLGHQLRLAAQNGYRGALQRAGERLMAKLRPLLEGHRPAASLLHGDLWPGNIAFDASAQPIIFDPATYYGDRETDVAMTELFGRLPAAFYAAYNEALPLDAGYTERKDLYNLYHVLNHLNLFGGGYLAQAERLIARLLAHA